MSEISNYSIIELRNWLSKELESRADAKYAAGVGRFIPGNIKTLGVRVPELRKLAREMGIKFGMFPHQWVQLLSIVIPDQLREEILVATFGLGRGASQLDDLFGEKISGLARELDNWETTDQLAVPVGYWVMADLSRVGYLEAMVVRGETVWKKRLGIVATTTMNHGGNSYPAETFKVIRHYMTTDEPILIKAIGWAIREVKDLDAVEKFLEPWAGKIRKSLLTESIKKLPESSCKKLREIASQG